MAKEVVVVQKQPPEVFCKKTCSKEKKETLTQVFFVNFTKFLRKLFYIEHLWWLLLVVVDKTRKRVDMCVFGT